MNLLPTYEIFSAESEILVKAKLNIWRTTYTITDSIDEHVIAICSRPFFQILFNNWTVTIEDMDVIDEKGIHLHMLLALPAFTVDKEYEINSAASCLL